jgi:hypothetical protein
MIFPRFTSGALGRLTFAELNEMMSLLEQLRPLLKSKQAVSSVDSEEVLMARIGNPQGSQGAMTWVEVVPDGSTGERDQLEWINREGGRSSDHALDDGIASEPAFVPFRRIEADGSEGYYTLPFGSVVPLRRIERIDGKPAWVALSGVDRGVFPARITGATQVLSQSWLYDWVEADRIGGGWQDVPLGRLGTAVNGAERGTAVGVGSPGIGTENNQPIATGTVVPMHQTASGTYYFALANDLQVICP